MAPSSFAAKAVSGRVDRIDLLRGLSILAVVVHHINLRIRIERTPIGAQLPRAIVSILGWNGHNGVIVFFAISGFLITTTCLRRWGALSQISLRGFYRLRLARIAPCLVALLIVLSALHLLGVPQYVVDPRRASLARALVAAFGLHFNWLEAHRGYLPANWDVLWSLSNEEMFYLFFPVLCLLARRRAILIGLLGAFVLLGPFARTVLTHNELWEEYGYLSAMDAIALGCLAAWAAHRLPAIRRLQVSLQVAGICLMAFVTLLKPWVRALGLYRTGLDVTLLAAGTALALIGFLHRDLPGSSFSAPLRWLGRNSYEVYLTHMMAIFSLLPLAKAWDPGWRWAPVWYLLMIGLAALVGGLVARYYSEPMNRWLRQGAARG